MINARNGTGMTGDPAALEESLSAPESRSSAFHSGATGSMLGTRHASVLPQAQQAQAAFTPSGPGMIGNEVPAMNAASPDTYIKDTAAYIAKSSPFAKAQQAESAQVVQT